MEGKDGPLPENDLPEFDLKEAVDSNNKSDNNNSGEDMVRPAKSTTTTASQQALPMSSTSFAPPPSPVKSVQDLIADRSLESKLQFFDDDTNKNNDQTTTTTTIANVDTDKALPDLLQLMRSSPQSSSSTSGSSSIFDSDSDDAGGIGKKKARQAERRAAAMAREEEEKEVDWVQETLGRVSFLVDAETGKVTLLKIVEAGTWFAIATLISWEVYINSPFFDRAAPMAPIVY